MIVITDEAHRTQYDILALNMRNALPNAGFLGFTGTPLIAGEERTREVFGDYVSVYNFAASAADHATVPLYYENRIPQLQIANPNFGDDLMAIVEEADLDESAGAPARPGSRAAVRADHPRRPARGCREGHRRPLPRSRVPRQGTGRVDRQGHCGPHVRQGPALLGASGSPKNEQALRARRPDAASRRTWWCARSRSCAPPTWPS